LEYHLAKVILIVSLSQEINTHSLPVEIICIDDASKVSFYPLLDRLEANPSIRLVRLKENRGRPAIRNLLAKEANYEHLLFLDNDGLPQHEDFVRKYLQSIESHPNAIIFGGRTYYPQAPKDQSYFLHWKYGQHREAVPAFKRNQKPYYGFQSNNFAVPKAVFTALQFDETVRLYGHEDTLFGLTAKSLNIPLVHIDNPAIHTGLEKKNVFLDKAAQACSNALFIYNATGHKAGRAIKMALNLEALYIARIVRWIIGNAISLIRINLLGSNPSLFLLDVYKLHLILTLLSKNKPTYKGFKTL
jgi:GT2 family glycosyltransferase